MHMLGALGLCVYFGIKPAAHKADISRPPGNYEYECKETKHCTCTVKSGPLATAPSKSMTVISQTRVRVEEEGEEGALVDEDKAIPFTEA